VEVIKRYKKINNMKKEFVPYEQALQLKELGFDEPCFAVYIDKTLIIEDDWLYSTNQDTFIESSNFTAPLYQQAFRFFRENYGVKVISVGGDDSQKYSYLIHLKDNTQVFGPFEKKDTYEEAELACLDKLIEIAKQKQ
jgi:hypothetical protein